MPMTIAAVPPRVLLIDNYDSFTYNLVQAFGVLGAQVRTVRNDAAPVADLLAWAPTHLVISPGPGGPAAAGVSNAALAALLGRVPVLGVCLGHQCLAAHFGAHIVPARRLMHGKTSTVTHDGRGLFAGLENPLTMARYHSLAVDETSLPDELIVTARAEDGEIMGLRHRTLTAEGVQFHPESFLSPAGPALLANFLGRREAAAGS